MPFLTRIFNDHVVEIRFKPNPKILDKFGHWTEEMSHSLNLENWRISHSSIDVYDKNQIEEATERAFLSAKNFGFVKINCPNSTFFPNRSSHFVKFLLERDGFENTPIINRIGLRTRFVNFYDGPFDDLKDYFIRNYCSPSANVLDIFNGKIIDIGSPVHFKTQYGTIKSMAGPMPHSQIFDFFKHPHHIEDLENFDKASLFIDIDYFVHPNKKMDFQEIKKIIELFNDENWRINNGIKDLLKN